MPSGRNINKVKRCHKPDYIATSNGVKSEVEIAFVGDDQRLHSNGNEQHGETHVLQVLLDTGYSKSIILKKFTEVKQRTKQRKIKQNEIHSVGWIL